MKISRVRSSMLKTSFLFCLSLLLIVQSVMITAVAAQEVNEEDQITIRHRLPKFVPLKVELIGLDSTNVLEDFEAKVTNMSNKPIYSLRFELETVDVKVSGAPIGFSLNYGRRELSSGANESEENNIKPTDVPINPNESITLKLRTHYKDTLKAYKRNIENGMFPKPQIYELVFIDLTYADRTGFTKRGFFNLKKH